jgi:hypothetical protein
LWIIPFLLKGVFETAGLLTICQIRHFERIVQNKKFLPPFEKVVQSITASCGFDGPDCYLWNCSSFFGGKVKKFSLTALCQFVMIVRWFWDISANSKTFILPKSSLEAFRRMTDSQFIWP